MLQKFMKPGTGNSVSLSVLALILALSPMGQALAQDRTPSDQQRGIYDKPYLTSAGGRVMVGGYMDMEFEWREGGQNTFDQHRFIPFLTGYVSDRVTVSAEIEFEHGGHVENGGGDGEIKLEYMVMDYKMGEKWNFRGGLILAPLGSFNLLHDSPLNDLTERPGVCRNIIPSTLSESGMGFFGNSAVGEEGDLSYEMYLVNGFDEGIFDDQGRLRVRGGRGSAKSDNNNNKAFTGRLGFSPKLGTNLGASVHTGKYDAEDNLGLTIAALDAKTVFGPLELKGELAAVSADIDRDLHPEAAESQRGAYAQAGYHLLHDKFLDGSVVTLVVRGDWVDYDTGAEGDSEEGLTLGANFRPTEETVFKFDYSWKWTTAPGSEKIQADGVFFFSLATYF